MADDEPTASDDTIRRVSSPRQADAQGDSQPTTDQGPAAPIPKRGVDESTERLPPFNEPVTPTAEETPTTSQNLGDADEGFEPGLEEAKTVIRQAISTGERKHENTGRTPAEIAKVLVGEQLNQYFLEAMIGGGGMGAVFRAHDQQLDRIVALKVIPFVGNDPELQRRFRNEAQNAAKLDHPRIARVFDAGNYNDWHYIVFEYIKGTNVRDLVDHHGTLSLDDAVVFTSQVAEALDHAAQRGIVHRDIKPSNVLVSDDGSIKLVDMGLARSDNLDLSEDMTASGVTLGTFDYISPEQAFDPRDADLRSDLYSLGCTFYFMVTGEAPFTGGTMLQKLISHGNAPPPNPQELRPDLPDEVVSVMHRMMAKDPQARYQNARDLLADLNELAYRFQLKRAQSIAVAPAPASTEGLQRLQTHLPWMIVALLILMIGGYLELQSTATREAFETNWPTFVNRTTTANPSASPTIAIPPEQSIDGQDPSTSSAGDSSAGTATGSGNSNADVMSPGDSTGTLAERSDDRSIEDASPGTSPSTTVNASEAAARPPSFGTDLPIPDVPDTEPMLDTSLPETPGGETPMERAETARDAIASSARDDTMDERTETSGLADASDSTESVGSASPTQPIPSLELPAPQSVRLVAPSLLALAMRVDGVDRDTDGSILAATLDDAIDLAMRFGVLRVELTTPEVITGPLTIPQDNMVFESTVGRTTVRMRSPDTLAIGRSEMLIIGNNRTRFLNLDFHWELAQEQVDGGSMFVINDNRLTRFQNCSFTLVNKAIHDGVSFFSIITDPEALPDSETLPGRLFNPNENALPLVALQLDNAIVRGEASFIRMDYAAALQLVWNNGLLAVSGRMIETAGARRRLTLANSPIQLSLSNVTAEIPLGLLRMRLIPTGSNPVPIERQADQCVFIVDEGQPFVEITGVDSLSSDQSLLKVRGEDNAYVGSPTLTDPLLLLTDRLGDTSVDSMEELASQRRTWIDERRPRWSVRWSSARPRSQTYHRLTPTNYRQDGAIYFGFQEPDLPQIQ